MGMCTCCSRERSDAKIRAGLRTLDTSGKSTTKPFHGPLCDDCLIRVSRIGSVEQRWLLKQIVRQNQERQVVQKPSAAWRRDVVVSFRPVRAKPREPRP
jgi:hypothetical protein